MGRSDDCLEPVEQRGIDLRGLRCHVECLWFAKDHVARRRGAHEAVIDRLAEADVRDRLDRDGGRTMAIQRLEMREQVAARPRADRRMATG